LVNRVAYGGERIILTSRGNPKAVLVSMEDYERLAAIENGRGVNRLEAWLQAFDQLAARISEKRKGETIDADTILAQVRRDLEERHVFLRDD
jgi:PHD/YefM family antitoxin component YafN of YafNO toxin-antitoxin module